MAMGAQGPQKGSDVPSKSGCPFRGRTQGGAITFQGSPQQSCRWSSEGLGQDPSSLCVSLRGHHSHMASWVP